MRPNITLFTALAMVFLIPFGRAQFSAARTAMEKIKDQQGNINLEVLSQSIAVGNSLEEQCEKVLESLEEYGKNLEQFNRDFGPLVRAAQTVRGQAELTRTTLASWVSKLERREDPWGACETVKKQVAELLVQWTELTKAAAEARKLLEERSKSASSTREDRVKEGVRREQEQETARLKRAEMLKKVLAARAVHSDAVERQEDAEEVENKAFDQWQEELSSGSKSSEVEVQLGTAWNEANSRLMELGRAAAEAHLAQKALETEFESAEAVYANALKELQKFHNTVKGGPATQANEYKALFEAFDKDYSG